LALLIKTLFFLVQLLPVRFVGAVGAGFGRLLYLLDSRHRNIALRNLNRIYPEKDHAWRIRTAHESFAELGRSMFEMPFVFMRSRAFLLSRIEVIGEAEYLAAAQQGHGIIVTAMHHSNWELGALSISLLGHESDMIYRSIRQPKLDDFVLKARSRFGTRLHSRTDGVRWLPRALKNGHTVAVMIDQHISNGTPVPFLGHMANTTTMPATFAAKYKSPIFAARLERIGRSFRFQLHLWPIEVAHTNSAKTSSDKLEGEIKTMQAVCEAFAPIIHQRPELWLWIHRRWLYLDEREQQAAA